MQRLVDLNMKLMSLGLALSLSAIPAFALVPPPPPNQQQGNSGSSDTFGTQVQQNTSQALQTFQNVNYKKLSGAQDQNYFFGDQTSTSLSDLQQQFKLAPEN
jgi:hypothetical protein